MKIPSYYGLLVCTIFAPLPNTQAQQKFELNPEGYPSLWQREKTECTENSGWYELSKTGLAHYFLPPEQSSSKDGAIAHVRCYLPEHQTGDEPPLAIIAIHGTWTAANSLFDDSLPLWRSSNMQKHMQTCTIFRW